MPKYIEIEEDSDDISQKTTQNLFRKQQVCSSFVYNTMV